jgi:hypothetical protein
MFTSSAFEVAIGLIFIYLVLSIICTGLSGATAALFGIRGRLLFRYISNFLEDEELVWMIYDHPLIYSVEDPRLRRSKHMPRLGDRHWLGHHYPARIPAPLFALALVDLLITRAHPERQDAYKLFLESPTPERAEKDILAGLPSGRLSWVIRAILHQAADGDIRALPTALAALYEYGTQIVVDQVRRWTRVYLWFWALALTIALNVNTTFIAEALWDQASGERVESIPIGWSQATQPFSSVEEFVGAVVGWLLTAGAISFGADFWLGLLERLGRVRPAEAKDEKSEGEKRDEGG